MRDDLWRLRLETDTLAKPTTRPRCLDDLIAKFASAQEDGYPYRTHYPRRHRDREGRQDRSSDIQVLVAGATLHAPRSGEGGGLSRREPTE